MGIIRGRVYHDREITVRRAEIGGPIPWIQCECGKWLDRETLEHVELATLTLNELMERFKIRCPDEEK